MEGGVEKVKIVDDQPRKSARRVRDDIEAGEALKRLAAPDSKEPGSHDGARRRSYLRTGF